MSNESGVVVCPHPKCRREIEEPILLNSLSTSPKEQYHACPYCFTKLDVDDEDTQPQKEEEEPTIEPLEKKQPMIKPPEKEQPMIKPVEKEEPTVKPLQKEEPKVKPPQKEAKAPSGCTHNFGYLANRPKNDPIPQECLTCSKIVDCMLKMSGT